MERIDDLPHGDWRLARVVETVTSKDGLVRKVKIHFRDKKMGQKGQCSSKPSIAKRTVYKLVLLIETV